MISGEMSSQIKGPLSAVRLKSLKLQQQRCKEYNGRQQVIHGGKYKPTVKIKDDHLSDKFRAFLEKERQGAE